MLMWLMSFKKALTTCIKHIYTWPYVCAYLFYLGCLCPSLVSAPLLCKAFGHLLCRALPLVLMFLYVSVLLCICSQWHVFVAGACVSLWKASLLLMFVLPCVPICCASIDALSFHRWLGCWRYITCDEIYQLPMRMISGLRLLGH